MYIFVTLKYSKNIVNKYFNMSIMYYRRENMDVYVSEYKSIPDLAL
jgi:hypothetical protein